MPTDLRRSTPSPTNRPIPGVGGQRVHRRCAYCLTPRCGGFDRCLKSQAMLVLPLTALRMAVSRRIADGRCGICIASGFVRREPAVAAVSPPAAWGRNFGLTYERLASPNDDRRHHFRANLRRRGRRLHVCRLESARRGLHGGHHRFQRRLWRGQNAPRSRPENLHDLDHHRRLLVGHLLRGRFCFDDR